MDSIVIVNGARTPFGSFLGELSSLPAPILGATAIKATLDRAGLDPELLNEVIMGNVLSAGVGQGPARQASLLAGVPKTVGCTTVNKLCGSGLKALMFAHDTLKAGSAQAIIAGGMESMSLAPHLLLTGRQGQKMGHQKLLDHMLKDGLEDAQSGRLMGEFAQDTADQHTLSREQMDEFAIESLKRAQTAQQQGLFAKEIVAVSYDKRGTTITVEHDEQPRAADAAKIPRLRPVFKADGGTITAANASSISDGAAALLLTTESFARANNLTIQARILGHSSAAREPAEFTLAPCNAIEQLLKQLNWQVGDVDLYEINEAFAMVAMLPLQQFGIDHSKVNVYGGACALGHPIGATGARLILTLINALQERGLRRGLATLCIGGGEATAMAIELAS